MSLFGDPPPADDPGDAAPLAQRPLADRMRPSLLDDVLGQDAVLGDGQALRTAIERGAAGSLILWGPPGCGKTTLALLIADRSGLHFEPFSAVLSGVKEVRAAVARADEQRAATGRGTLLFVDEIHRFNKAQQDAFLPHVESGRIVLVGATTENPAFAVIRALLSRCRVVQLQPLDDAAIERVVRRALSDAELGLGARDLSIDEHGLAQLVLTANGDARRALTALEAAASSCVDGHSLTADDVAVAAQQRVLAHDKSGDHHFDLLSALHKSLRNSDVQASVYWLARFLEAGADPLQAARRMLAVAAEDVGLADPMALQIAVAAHAAFERLGLPEGRLPLTQAAVYLASAPKSNAIVRAIGAAQREVREGRQHAVPDHLCNAPTGVHRDVGKSVGYVYAHDAPGGVADFDCLPEALAGAEFYRPGTWGFETKMRERLDDLAARRREREGS